MLSDESNMITGAQMRAARALVGWSADDLARRSRLDIATVSRAEMQNGLVAATPDNARAIRAALEAAGVEFIPENGGGAGVRLRKTGRPDEGLRPDQLTTENDL